MSPLPPCVLFEDDHLLVINKPPGLNTHAPAPFAGEGIYDWLRNREPRWASLATIHRLDKDTSGVLVFGKTPLANHSLTDQFTRRSVIKKYLFLTDHAMPDRPFTARSALLRAGERYLSRPAGAGVEAATHFRVLKADRGGPTLGEAEPLTGRTHQIRVQAAAHGFPILGDTLYGGTAWKRLCLHSTELRCMHPATSAEIAFGAPPDFELEPGTAWRDALVGTRLTNAYRLIHGRADAKPGIYLDRFAEFGLLSSEAESLARSELDGLHPWFERGNLRTVYYKHLSRRPASTTAPSLLLGAPAPHEFVVRENGLHYAISFAEGYSVGLFLDQRDNRRRLLVNHVAPGFAAFGAGAASAEVLNTFSYTCAFSVCAAKAGARTTSLDLSKKYLEWGRRNFALNGLAPEAHDFIYGDAFDWMKRLAKKKRLYDVVVLDPPSFSRSKEHGVFQVEKDYGTLVKLALAVLKPNGVLFAATNLATFKPEAFVHSVTDAIQSGRRKILQQHYAPQPPDFPITRAEPGYLKSLWLRVR